MMPHHTGGQYFSSWVDFKLKIYNATESDSGIYKFKATNAKGDYEEEQLIYVDISERKKKKIQGDYEDYGKVKKKRLKPRKKLSGNRRKERRRLRQLRRERKLAKKQKIWEDRRKLLNEPK